jgi:hypothetical protein
MEIGFLILGVLHYLENAPLAFYIPGKKHPGINSQNQIDT